MIFERFVDNDPTPVEELTKEEEEMKPLIPWWANIIIFGFLLLVSLIIAKYKRNKKGWKYVLFLLLLFILMGLMFGLGIGLDSTKNKIFVKMPAWGYALIHIVLFLLTLGLLLFKKK